MQESKGYIYDKLKYLSETDIYPCHMPGHKRNMAGYRMSDFYDIDITEIEGFDNLHQPKDLLKESMKRTAEFYGSENTYYLINGSSSGVLTALMSTVSRGGKVIAARNAHKSAYNALMLGEMSAVYLYPPLVKEYGIAGGILPEDLEDALKKNPDCEAVFVTSPTYDGIISDVERLVAVAHAYQVPVIVDEAHGAHLSLLTGYESAVSSGADLVIQSVHKTLPAFTQTALLHRNGTLISKEKLEKYLSIFQSSSPSYLLMAGIDECFRVLQERGTILAEDFMRHIAMFYDRIEPLERLSVFHSEIGSREKEIYGIKACDPGKILISVKKTLISGKALYEKLYERYHLQMEMAADTYALAIMTLMDSREGFERLADALLEIDHETKPDKSKNTPLFQGGIREGCMTIWQAESKQAEYCPLGAAAGRIAAESISLYPPGIPLVVPGEMMESGLTAYLQECLAQGLTVQGMSFQKTTPYIRVLI